jgi:hypothetical protein
MKALRAVSLTSVILVVGLCSLSAQQWTPLTNQPTFQSPSQEFLLTDGRVMVQDNSDGNQSNWWILTPDSKGSYVNGIWSQAASIPASFNYGPLFYASAILPDGNLAILGGEYNFGTSVWFSKGALYNPVKNKWTELKAPKGLGQSPNPGVGDAASVVLENGDWFVAACCDGKSGASVAAPGDHLDWKATGTGKADNYDEENFTLLPGGKVLLVDTETSMSSEIYDPATGAWTSAGSTIVETADPIGDEVGPAVLRYDGTVLQTGATGHNAVYDSKAGSWSAAPDFPVNGGGFQLAIYDGPASILPNGNVLVMTAPLLPGNNYGSGAQFFEWDGAAFNPVPGTPNAPNDPSFVGRMLVLPDGGVMLTDYSQDVEIYYPSGGPDPSWAPTITSVNATKLHPGEKNRKLTGTQLTGLSEGAAFGDDFQDATNYPLITITNNATGDVFFCRTHNFSSGVATGSTPQDTYFDVPEATELGASELKVVTNGIASAPLAITITK